MFDKLRDKTIYNLSFIIHNLLEYGLYLFVFLLPWQTKLILRPERLNGGVWEYGTISLYGTDILLAVLLLLFFVLSLRAKAKPACRQAGNSAPRDSEAGLSARGEIASLQPEASARNDKTVWIILSVLDLAVFVSVFFAPDKALALYRYVLFLFGIGLFWLAAKTEFNKVKMAAAFLSGLIVQAVLAIWQFLAQTAFSSKWLGMPGHSPGDLGASVVETFSFGGASERWLRAYGSLDHPNVLGGFLAIGLILLVLMLVRRQRALDKKNDKKFIIYNLSFIIIFIALLFSFSRSAWLALAAGLAVIFVFYLWRKDFSSLKRLGGVFLLLAALGGLAFANYHNLFFVRAGASARLELKSFSERRMYLGDSLGLIGENRLFGSGLGNYTKALAAKEPRRPWHYLQPVHNVFLLVWAEAGVFSLLFFIALPVYLFASALKREDILSLSMLAALAIMMIFDHYFWSSHFGILFFWLLLGYSFKNKFT